MSRIYSFLGQKQKALEHYQQALTLARATGSQAREATTLHNLGNLYHSLGEMEKSLDFYQQSLALARALGDRRREALTLNSVGTVYDDLGEKQKALEQYTQSLPLRRAVGDRRGEGVTLHNLGSLYLDLGEYQKALDYYNQALTIERNLGDRLGEATTLSRMGAVYDDLGEYQKSLDHYGQALRLQRAMEDRGGEALTLNNIGFVYNSLGEAEKALDYYQQSLPLLQAVGNRFQEGAVFDNIGKVHYSRGEKQKALEYFTRALSLYQSVRNRNGEAIALNNLGILHNSPGERQKAINYYNQSLALYQATGNRRETSYTLHNLGRAYAGLGETQKALDYFNQALEINRTLGDRKGEAVTRYGIALVERDHGNLKEAYSQVASALELIESLRAGIVSQELRASFFATVQDHYSLSVDLLMQLERRHPNEGFAARALETSERARARGLLETLTEARAEIRQGVDPALLERERAVQRRLNAREQARLQLLGRAHTPEQAAAADRELRELTAQYQELQAQIKTSSPRYAALTHPQPLRLAEIQREALDAGTLLLEYALGEERSYLWAVTGASIRSFTLPKRAEIETAAQRVYELLAARQTPDDEYWRAAATLSRMILGPVAAQLGRKRLVVVADGALQYVPFAALPKPGVGDRGLGAGKKNPQSPIPNPQPLIFNHEIVSLPSASTLAVLRRELAGRAVAPKTIALLADPVYEKTDERVKTVTLKADDKAAADPEPGPVGGFAGTRALKHLSDKSGCRSATNDRLCIPRLPYTRQEAERILALTRADEAMTALDFKANRATATSGDLGQYRFVHLATHGYLDSERPELSALLLSLVDEQGRTQDGFLRAHEVYNLNLPAELVVLSACETGLGKQIRGEGLVGLTRGFMYAGAARVVVSLWSVNDRATAELMERFYKAMLKGGQRPAAALRAAQVEMWKDNRWRAPYYWAAFGLQGEWR